MATQVNTPKHEAALLMREMPLKWGGMRRRINITTLYGWRGEGAARRV